MRLLLEAKASTTARGEVITRPRSTSRGTTATPCVALARRGLARAADTGATAATLYFTLEDVSKLKVGVLRDHLAALGERLVGRQKGSRGAPDGALAAGGRRPRARRPPEPKKSTAPSKQSRRRARVVEYRREAAQGGSENRLKQLKELLGARTIVVDYQN